MPCDLGEHGTGRSSILRDDVDRSDDVRVELLQVLRPL